MSEKEKKRNDDGKPVEFSDVSWDVSHEMRNQIENLICAMYTIDEE